MASPVITFLISNNSKTSGTTLTATAGSKTWSAGDYLVAHLAIDPSAGTVSFGAVTNFGAWATNVEFTNGSGTSGARSAVAYCKCTTGFTSTAPVVATFPAAAAQVLSLFSVTGADGTTPVRGSSGTAGLGGTISATAGNNFDGAVLQMPGIEGPSGTSISWGSTAGWTSGANSATSAGTTGGGSASNISAGYCVYTAAGVTPGGGGVFSGTTTGTLASVVLLFASPSGPSIVVYKDAYTIGSAATRVLTQRTVATGDVVVVVGQTEDFGNFNVASLALTAGTATIGTVTKQREAGTGSHCANGLFTFIVTSGGTMTLTATFNTTPAARRTTFFMFVATGFGGVGNTAMTTTSATTITASLATAANSCVIAMAADWAATGGATTTLTPAGFVLDAHETDGVVDSPVSGTFMSSRGGHWASVSAGTVSYGVTVPTSAAYNLVVCELLAAGAAPVGILPQQAKKRMPAIFTRIVFPRRSGAYSR